MSNEKIICPRCKGNRRMDYLVNNHQQNCFTCNGENSICQEHDDLFELGFAEHDDNDIYRLYFEKMLNPLEEIRVIVKRVGRNLVIEKMSIKSPYANELQNRLFDVKQLITFLRNCHK
jgi:hypothetical protein